MNWPLVTAWTLQSIVAFGLIILLYLQNPVVVTIPTYQVES